MSAQHRVPVILTRAQAQSERFAALLPRGTYAVISPLLEIVFLPPVAPPDPSETVLFTSENGVLALKSALGQAEGRIALCVGDRTALAARAAGWMARSARGNADDLLVLARGSDGPFVHVRGEHTRGALAERLSAAGRPCREIVVYTQRALPLSQQAEGVLRSETPSIVPLFSPRTAQIFARACPRAERAHLACISAATAAALDDGKYASIRVSSEPDASAMLDTIAGLVKTIHLETGQASG